MTMTGTKNDRSATCCVQGPPSAGPAPRPMSRLRTEAFGSRNFRPVATSGTSVPLKKLTAVGLIGDGWYAEALDIFNPVSDVVDIIELFEDEEE